MPIKKLILKKSVKLSPEKFLETLKKSKTISELLIGIGYTNKFHTRTITSLNKRFKCDINKIIEQNAKDFINSKPIPQYVCKNCGKIFNEKYSKWSNGNFCSKECARSFSTKNKRKEINEKVSKILKEYHSTTLFNN